MICDCGSHRVISIVAKCSDMFQASTPCLQYSGYVPNDLGIGSGDYLDFSYCFDCGKIVGDFPIQSSSLQYFTAYDFYEDHKCPDCQTDIARDALLQSSCEECRHVFNIDPDELEKNVSLNL